MASPVISGSQLTADATTVSDRTATAPTGIADGDAILMGYGQGNLSKPTISPDWNGTSGGSGFTEYAFADATSSTVHVDTWLGTANSADANLYKIHTSAGRACVWALSKLTGADLTLANWASQPHHQGAGTAVTVGLSTLTNAPTSDRLFVSYIAGSDTTATDPTSLPDSWQKVGSAISAGSGAGYLGVFYRNVAANEVPADQVFNFGGAGGNWEVITLSIPASTGSALNLTGIKGATALGVPRFGALTTDAPTILAIAGKKTVLAQGTARFGQLAVDYLNDGGLGLVDARFGVLDIAAANTPIAGVKGATALGAARFGALTENTLGNLFLSGKKTAVGSADSRFGAISVIGVEINPVLTLSALTDTRFGFLLLHNRTPGVVTVRAENKGLVTIRIGS